MAYMTEPSNLKGLSKIHWIVIQRLKLKCTMKILARDSISIVARSVHNNSMNLGNWEAISERNIQGRVGAIIE